MARNQEEQPGYQGHHSVSCSSKDLSFTAFSTGNNQLPAQLPQITRRSHQLWSHRRLSSLAHSCLRPSLTFPAPAPTRAQNHPSNQSKPLAARLQDATGLPRLTRPPHACSRKNLQLCTCMPRASGISSYCPARAWRPHSHGKSCPHLGPCSCPDLSLAYSTARLTCSRPRPPCACTSWPSPIRGLDHPPPEARF